MSVRARVTLTIQIQCSSHWGDNVEAKQVRQQAIEEAMTALRTGFVVEGLQVGGGLKRTGITIVGEPQVMAVIADLEPS